VTACDLLVKALERGLTLLARGDRLAVRPDSLLTTEFVEMLRAHKPELLRLLNLTFIVVQSEVLGETVLFVPDDQTKHKVVASGAEPGNVYTRAELAVLVDQRITADELRLIHKAKRRFNGKITP
jgi:hypothetical protein